MVVGIDLGTTNTLACYFVRGKKKLLKFKGGAVMLPSVIYTDENNKVFVGEAAQSRGATNPERMIRSAKRYIGDLELNKTWTCGGRTYTPTDVATEVLKKVRQSLIDYQKLGDDEKIDAVITVPAYFNDNQRDETRKAGEAAGFNVMRILEEPTAAAIEAVHEKQLDKKVFVVDIGGGTFDLSVLEADHQNHLYNVIAIDGDDRLGGDDFDLAIQQEFIRHIEDDTGVKFTDAKSAGISQNDWNSLMNRLIVEARDAKEELSEVSEHEVNLSNLTTLGGKPYNLNFVFTRKALEKICRPLFDKIFNQLKSFAQDNKRFKRADIGHVILAGGTCFIPYIKEGIEREIGIKPDDELPLSQLVVTGAARYAESMSGVESGDSDFQRITLKGILAHSLGIDVVDKSGRHVFDKIIEKDTPYPCEVTRPYQTVFDNQTQIEVMVYEAANENSSDLNAQRFRGSLILKNLPAAPRGQSKVSVKFAYTEDQRLKVTVADGQDSRNFKEALIDKTTRGSAQPSIEPIDMVLMLDSSGSMEHKIADARAACSDLINEMIDLSVHRMALINFDSSPCMRCRLTSDARTLTNPLYDIMVGGATDMVAAFRVAFGELENSTRQKIVLMVTDGYPYTGYGNNDYADTISYAQDLRRRGVKIIAIGVGENFNKSFLDELAGAKNSFTINNMTQLAATFERVMNALARGEI